MRPDTLAVLWFCVAAIICAPFAGHLWRTVAQVKARRLAEEERICAPLPPERNNLAEIEPVPAYVQGIRVGGRQPRDDWPERQTPTDLAAAYEPIHWRDEVATTPHDYRPRHAAWPVPVDVTGEFRAIVRNVVFDEELAEVAT